MVTSQENIEEDNGQEENQHSSPKVSLESYRWTFFYHVCLPKEDSTSTLDLFNSRSGGKPPGENADEAQQQLQDMGLAERDTSMFLWTLDLMEPCICFSCILQSYSLYAFASCKDTYRHTLIHAPHAPHDSWFILKCHVC